MRLAIVGTIVALLFIAVQSSPAQGKFVCKSGHIWFSSHTPLEDIEAHNNEAAGVINTATGDIAFQVLIKAFKFKRALMEEHFNENYMESSTFPKSDFKGRILNLDSVNFSRPGSYRTVVEGNLTIHNKTNKVRQTGTIEVKENTLRATATFDVAPQDYGIEIPGAVRDKIAKAMTVSVDMTYTPYTK